MNVKCWIFLMIKVIILKFSNKPFKYVIDLLVFTDLRIVNKVLTDYIIRYNLMSYRPLEVWRDGRINISVNLFTWD